MTLSVGRRCQEEGWGFYWPPWSASPIFIDPQGNKHYLVTDGFIPYLRSNIPVVAAAVMMEGGCAPGTAAIQATCCAMPEIAAPGKSVNEESDEGEKEEIEEFDHRGMCERDLREEAVSIAHLMTHFPKNPYCKACLRARLRRMANRRRKGPKLNIAPAFGSCVTLDHVYAHSEEMEGIDGSLDMLVCYDIGTEKIDAYPAKSKDHEDTYQAVPDFRGSTYLDTVYSD